MESNIVFEKEEKKEAWSPVESTDYQFTSMYTFLEWKCMYTFYPIYIK